MLARFLTFLNLIDIFANVFNWVEISTLNYDLELLYENIRRVELQVSQVDDLVNSLENQFDINLYCFRAEKDRKRLEVIYNQ
jgi:hypothetical protein